MAKQSALSQTTRFLDILYALHYFSELDSTDAKGLIRWPSFRIFNSNVLLSLGIFALLFYCSLRIHDPAQIDAFRNPNTFDISKHGKKHASM